MRDGITNNPLLVVDVYHNRPCRENPGTDSPKVPTNVAYVSEEDGGISEIDLSTLKVICRVEPSDLSPRGLAVTFDGKYVITSNKNTSDGAVFSTTDLSLLRRVHIGQSPEFSQARSRWRPTFRDFRSQFGGRTSRSSESQE
jgi:DNA-binding beta-propeller fold protein YncE